MMKVYLIAQLANSFYIAGAWREISVEGVRTREKKLDYRRRSKQGGSGGMLPLKIFKFWNWASYLNGV